MSVGDLVNAVLIALDWLVLGYFVLVNGMVSPSCSSRRPGSMRRHRQDVWGENRWRVLSSEVAPTVSTWRPPTTRRSR